MVKTSSVLPRENDCISLLFASMLVTSCSLFTFGTSLSLLLKSMGLVISNLLAVKRLFMRLSATLAHINSGSSASPGSLSTTITQAA